MAEQDVTGRDTALVSEAANRMGWDLESGLVREAVPSVRRGASVLLVCPPSPALGAPVVAAGIEHVLATNGRMLVLAAPALVGEWGATLAAVAGDTPLRVEAARGPSRASRAIRAGTLDVLVAAPEVALTLLTRSALDAARFTSIVFAWPEGWDADEAMTVLLQEFSRDAQRVVLTAEPSRADQFADRFARKALMFGVPSRDPDQPRVPVERRESIRTVQAPWASRATAVAEVIEATDPERVGIWTADRRDHAALRAALGGRSDGITIDTTAPSDMAMVICYDLPTSKALAAVDPGADVVVLVPPGTEQYAASLAHRTRPLQRATPSIALVGRDAALRAEIATAVERGDLDAQLYAIAPMFERFDPQLVAAALFRLWQSRPGSVAAPAEAPATTPVGGVATTKLWVGVGKKDEATVGDLVAVLVKEVGVDRTLIGRVELRDTFSLVEVPSAEAERIARGLTGITIRRRKVVARPDRGPGAPDGPRGGSDRPRGPGRGPMGPRGDRRPRP